MPMIKLVDPALAEFTTKPELLAAMRIGKDVSQLPGNVIPALRRSKSDLLKSSDLHVRSARNWIPIDRGIWTQVKAQSFCIKCAVRVMEDLVEIVHTGQHLVGHARRD